MLSKTIVHACTRCGSERLCKNGHANNGAQRAKCLECGCTFILEPEGPRYDDAFREQVVRAYQDRMSTRGIQRTFGVCYQTLMAWVEKNLEGLPALEDTLLPSQAGDVLELDELWSFVQAKWQECWLWVAVCRRTRQIVYYTLGDRSRESAWWLRESIPEDYIRRATRSDFWDAYGVALPKHTHRFCGKEEGETNHAERCFGTLRARLSRLVRKTYSFSKCVDRHAEAIHLFIVNHNLAIQRKSSTD